MVMAKDKRLHGFRDSYYQDHSRKIVLGADGNPHVEYVYEGIYYTLDGSDRRWRLGKLLHLALTTGAAAVLLSVMLTETPGNHRTDITLLQVICLFLFFGAGIGVFNRLTAPRHMTRWEYRMGVATVRECSALLLLCLGALLADELVSAALGRLVFDRTSALVCLKTALCLLLVFAQYRLVKKERYSEHASDDLPHGIDITNDFEAMP